MRGFVGENKNHNRDSLEISRKEQAMKPNPNGVIGGEIPFCTCSNCTHFRTLREFDARFPIEPKEKQREMIIVYLKTMIELADMYVPKNHKEARRQVEEAKEKFL